MTSSRSASYVMKADDPPLSIDTSIKLLDHSEPEFFLSEVEEVGLKNTNRVRAIKRVQMMELIGSWFVILDGELLRAFIILHLC